MTALHDYLSRDALEASLAERFVEEVAWPIPQGWLTAIVDMGMSDEAIARYFSVTAHDVAALRAEYGLVR